MTRSNEVAWAMTCLFYSIWPEMSDALAWWRTPVQCSYYPSPRHLGQPFLNFHRNSPSPLLPDLADLHTCSWCHLWCLWVNWPMIRSGRDISPSGFMNRHVPSLCATDFVQTPSGPSCRACSSFQVLSASFLRIWSCFSVFGLCVVGRRSGYSIDFGLAQSRWKLPMWCCAVALKMQLGLSLSSWGYSLLGLSDQKANL